MKIWDEVEKAYAEKKVVIGRVIERIKGGLAVDIGVRAFLPGSAGGRASRAQPRRLRGQELRMRVIKVNKKRGNIVLSARRCSRRRTPRRRSTRSRRWPRGRCCAAW
jgi:small subunit ribosomal protein S1